MEARNSEENAFIDVENYENVTEVLKDFKCNVIENVIVIESDSNKTSNIG